MLQLTFWSVPSLTALLLASAALVQVRARRTAAGAPALGALCLCVMAWSLGQLCGTLTTDLSLKLLASQLQYPAIPLLPVTWLAFALTYSGRLNRLGKLPLAMLCAAPLATTALAWSNAWHGWLWADARLATTEGFTGLDLTYGPWFDVHLVYSYGSILLGTFIAVYELSASRRHRRALAAVIAGPAVVAVANIAYLSGANPWPFIDPTPLGFAVGNLLLAYGVLHTGLLDLSPGLHRQIIRRLADPVIVLDGLGRMVDLNPAAAELLGVREATATGKALGELLHDRESRDFVNPPDAGLELAFGSRAYHVRGSRLGMPRDNGATTVLVWRDISARRQAEAELQQVKRDMERLAYTDPLTGLHNRRSFMQRLEEECSRAQRQQQALSVLLLDLDEFKLINDSYGHEAGDRALQAVASLIEGSSRLGDMAARLGGEEFALLLPGSYLEGARRLAERLRQAIADQVVHCTDTEPFQVTTSIGVVGPDAGEVFVDPVPDELLRRADEALYRAKAGGRDRVCIARYAGELAASTVASIRQS